MGMTKKQRKALKSINLDLFLDYYKYVPESHSNEGNSLPENDVLYMMFESINYKYFNSALPQVLIEWSTRMRAAGKYYLGSKIIRLGRRYHEYYPNEVEDTLKHEMLHILYPNHGKVFKREAERIGTSRHAKAYPGGRSPHKYIYVCSSCGQKYHRHKRLRMASCGKCSNKGFDARYKLKLFWTASKTEEK
jgi:predicted SprT family Zn-dependent metalloprotease